MKSLAELKRRLAVGVEVTMVAHDWLPKGKLLNISRAIEIKQTNSIMFEGGSWLDFPKAKECIFYTDDNKFSIRLDETSIMTYIIGVEDES